MVPGSPLFSIVIPTRNRGHLLRHALRSALEQEFDDYEIVVVANDCRDDTRDVVRALDDGRVRYFETDHLLTMPENWEFAWTKAAGKYITYLPDDDALVPTALRALADGGLDGAPPVISWEDATYYYPTWHDANTRNTVVLFYHGEHAIEDVSASVFRQQCERFEFAWSAPIPKLLNCAVEREFFEGWRGDLGQLFFPVAPDYSFAWIASHVCQEIRVVRRPLSVRGVSDYSIGSNAGLGAASQEFFKEFSEIDFFADTLVRVPVTLNHLAATFLRASVAMRRAGVSVEEVNWGRFLVAASRQLRENENLVTGWAEHAEDLLNAAGRISPEIRSEVQAILSTPVHEDESPESLRELRDRTAKMALEYQPNLSGAAAGHLGDERCARCVLGLEGGVLAEAGWEYVYIFGEEIGASDPYAVSRRVDEYYDLLLRCREKRRQALAGEAISSGAS